MTGLEAIRQSIALSGHTSFYILTGYDRFEYAREAISIGVKDFLLKPLETHTVEEILKRERAHQESARRQIRSEFASLVSSALLTGSGAPPARSSASPASVPLTGRPMWTWNFSAAARTFSPPCTP